MSQPGTITIVATIKKGKANNLAKYLRKSIDVKSEIRKDNKDLELQFFDIGSLHMCSFLIINADAGLNEHAKLIFEATIDGGRRDFIEDLVETSPSAIGKIFGYCEGFPDVEMKYHRLVVDYLMTRVVSDSTYFCGYPGRSVTQIKAESILRENIRSLIDGMVGAGNNLAPTIGGIHRRLKKHLRISSELGWAQEKVQAPHDVRFGRSYIVAVMIVFVALFAGIAGWIFDKCYSLSFGDIWNQLHNCTNSLALLPGQTSVLPTECQLVPEMWFLSSPSIVTLVATFGIVWLAALFLSLSVPLIFAKARESFYQILIGVLADFTKFASYGFLIICGLVALLKYLAISGFLPTVVPWWNVFLVITGLLLVLWVLAFLYAKRQRSLQLGAPISINIVASKFAAESISVLRYFAYAGLTVIILSLNGELASAISKYGNWILSLVATFGIFICAGLVIILAVVLVVLLITRLWELIDQIKYQDCSKLVRRAQLHGEITAREEQGYNVNQNHLASVVHVKSGFFRPFMLRVVMTIVGLLARYEFNKGTLAEISTILSARWILIENGKRLVFMTNYVGAWDSYINEFLDLSGVLGVNAFWSNTVLPDPDSRRKINFPLTKYLLWDGAENEQEFKAYIRESQVETLAWYCAYPNMSVSNINNNTALRNAIFENLSSAELDELSGRL